MITFKSSLQSFLNQDDLILFKFYYCKEAKDLKWQDLINPEKVVVFNKINVLTSLPGISNINAIQLLWKIFESLYNLLHTENISFSL